MPILLNDNLNINAPRPNDNRFGPYSNTDAVLAAVPVAQRYIGLTVGVLGAGNVVSEYWFNDGTANSDLVIKTTDLTPAYDQANAAYAQANTAYDAANNARVTVFANNASNVTTQNINFVNTSTISVSVSPDTSNANVQFDLTELQYNTSTTSAEVVDFWSAANFRSGKYHMQVENYLGFLATDLMLLHDGNTTNLSLFGSTSLGGSTGVFTSDLTLGFVRLLFTPSDSTTNLTFTRKLLQNRGFEPLPTDLMLGINTYDLMNILYISPTDLNA
jgi:hypothetical protein